MRPGRRDDGQFLLVSGIIVTLGFLVIATTFVTLGPWEASPPGGVNGTLVDSAQEVVETLEATLEGLHRPGQMNRTDFQQVALATQMQLEQNAVRSGMFASVRLAQDTDLGFVQQNGRCLGLDPDGSAGGGVVYGWDQQSLRKGIVGAVYEIYVTDGHKSLRIDHYVKLEECAADQVFTHASGWAGPIGALENFSAAHVDDNQPMTLTEELDWANLVEVSVHPTINQSSIEIKGNWNQQNNMLNLDGTYTVMSSNSASLPDNNWFRFHLVPPLRMGPQDTLPNVTLEITGYKDEPADPDKPQSMWLYVYGNDSWEDPLIKEEFDLPLDSPDALEIVFDELYQGVGHWRYADVVDSRWELKLMGTHHPNQKWNIDHFNMTGSMMMAQAYRLNVTFEWPEIPAVYGQNELHLRYRFEAATPDEGFHLLVRDLDGDVADGDWLLVHNMTDTTALPDGRFEGVFTTAEGPMGPQALVNRMELRVMDTDHYDNWVPADRDAVEIELLRVKSTLDG